jgi:hypothetical protein
MAIVGDGGAVAECRVDRVAGPGRVPIVPALQPFADAPDRSHPSPYSLSLKGRGSRVVQTVAGTDPVGRGGAPGGPIELPRTICSAVPTIAPILPRSVGMIIVVLALARLPHWSM